MVATDRIATIFTDARTVHANALERSEQGDIRDAAEKAWCATKRATDALVLARTEQEPQKSPDTSKELRKLALQDQRMDGLVNHYLACRDVLHGDCFYLGLCKPVEDTERRIRETALYIRDAEALAQS